MQAKLLYPLFLKGFIKLGGGFWDLPSLMFLIFYVRLMEGTILDFNNRLAPIGQWPRPMSIEIS